MQILTINCGSSSLKYKLSDMPSEKELVGGEAQRIGLTTSEPSQIVQNAHGKETIRKVPMQNHASAFQEIIKSMQSDTSFHPEGIGQRFVHGGEQFRSHCLLTSDMVLKLEDIAHLAPIHNPLAIQAVQSCQKLFPKTAQVLVFDTAFHASIPEYAYTYALPKQLREPCHFRKYGFHGTSHQYVAQEAARYLDIPLENLNAVSCHLGSGGASLCAIANGKSIDNTMGYSPLQGLLMSTRCGDLNSAIVLQLLSLTCGDNQSIETILNKKSGVLGVSGVSSDIRDVLDRYNSTSESTNQRLKDAINLYQWRIRKYLGSYLAVLGKTDTVIFTDTIGENVPAIRSGVCENMDVFGIQIDPHKNQTVTHTPIDISTNDSAVRILVVRTNEELAIARVTHSLLQEAA